MENTEKRTLGQAFEELKANKNNPLEDTTFMILTDKVSVINGTPYSLSQALGFGIEEFIDSVGLEEGKFFANCLKAGIDTGVIVSTMTELLSVESMEKLDELLKNVLKDVLAEKEIEGEEQEDETQA